MHIHTRTAVTPRPRRRHSVFRKNVNRVARGTVETGSREKHYFCGFSRDIEFSGRGRLYDSAGRIVRGPRRG